MSDCLIPGCVVRGQHVTDATQAHPDTCKGCLPRPAEPGVALCTWHLNRFEDAVTSIPSLVAHLREIGKPYAQAAPLTGDLIMRGDPAEHVNLPAAWMAADEIENELLGWVRCTIEESPRRLSWPDRKPWRGNIPQWMLDHLRDAASLPFGGEMARSMTSTIETVRHRWPTADDVEPVQTLAMPCPRCGLVSLTRTPPRWAGQMVRIECTDPDCARVFTEDEYDSLLAIANRDGKMGKWKVEESA